MKEIVRTYWCIVTGDGKNRHYYRSGRSLPIFRDSRCDAYPFSSPLAARRARGAILESMGDGKNESGLHIVKVNVRRRT